ncbi:hypothetical protein I4641_21440 [Waterburya agarophytonicola K14]|uniref:EfeO-type cupredoxin-like domain-containing protein n=1 Tax=Waterburya agarophytonicola KI4 TaxID=2874699 RepID=A0A964BW85_9CYAN|nr:hypothetical protein [Waterburya agarophytonicola]MCC0179527.1 hypothetical protein [Waterburya agarophytonicola KI4]
MKYFSLISSSLLCLVLAGCYGDRPDIPASKSNESTQSDTSPIATVVELTQVGCQFLEVEAKNYQYQPTSAEDCNKINSQTLAARKSEFKPLELKPGKYIFRVTNENVSYPLGFYLRGSGIQKVTLPKVSGGGLSKGTTKDYEITLKPGEYVFSCPLNPTPDYPIVVN